MNPRCTEGYRFPELYGGVLGGWHKTVANGRKSPGGEVGEGQGKDDFRAKVAEIAGAHLIFYYRKAIQ